jgi:hypothetical protein
MVASGASPPYLSTGRAGAFDLGWGEVHGRRFYPPLGRSGRSLSINNAPTSEQTDARTKTTG